MLLNVLRCQLTYQGQTETNAEAWVNTRTVVDWSNLEVCAETAERFGSFLLFLSGASCENLSSPVFVCFLLALINFVFVSCSPQFSGGVCTKIGCCQRILIKVEEIQNKDGRVSRMARIRVSKTAFFFSELPEIVTNTG